MGITKFMNRRSLLLNTLALPLLSLAVPALGHAIPREYSDDDLLDPLYDTIKEREELGMLQQVLYAASYRENAGDDFVRILRKEKYFTVFAPTNESINKSEWTTIEALIKNSEDDASRKKLRQIVGKHIVRGKFTQAEVEQRAGKPFQTLAGTTLSVTVVQKDILLNKNRLQKRDGLQANNGLIHFIDGFITS
jgi:uncharacterized surface protein with fasciclin (FAS1) repeats